MRRSSRPVSIRRNVTAVTPKTEDVLLSSLKPAARMLRTHSRAKRSALLRSIERFSLIEPIVINSAGVIVNGHARVEAARQLGWKTITAVRVEHLTEEDLRLFAIAANKLPADASWDFDALRQELEELEAAVAEIDLTLSGFDTGELDRIVNAFNAAALNDLDDIPSPPKGKVAVARLGDVFEFGDHRLICGDALDPAVLATLMGDDLADVIFTDPPYNVRIAGHVSGRGRVHHREFPMASGEMSSEAFETFLRNALSTSAIHLRNGGLCYACIDHAHVGEMIAAGAAVFEERKAICVWDKGVGGMGSLYRNAHELVVVFKKGTVAHINNVALGKHGRDRTTMWRYPGVGGFGKGRDKALSLHPTVKPVALVADAILDATSRGGIVLDPFGGSGTTMIAAHKMGRRSRLVELDPSYVDVIVQRVEAATGIAATHAQSGSSFADLRAARMASPDQQGSV